MPHVVASDGARIHVCDEGTGPAVVLLAGWSFSAAVWGEHRADLARDHRVVGVDLRGHGASDAPDGDYSVARLADDVAGVLDALELTQAAVVGWSFGGMVASRLAAIDGRVGSLVLVGSAGVATGARPGFPFGQDATALRDALITAEQRGGSDARRVMIAGGFARSPPDDVLERLAADAAAMPSSAAVACLRTLFDTEQFDILPRLQRIAVLQVVGAQDSLHPHEAVRWIDSQLTRGDVTVLDGCGHYPMFEAPGRFAEAVRSGLHLE